MPLRPLHMKKTLIIVSLVAGLLTYQASAQQPTVTVSGTSGQGAPGDMVTLTMQLSVGQALPSNVTGLNLLLETPTTGANSGVGFFTVAFSSGSASFPISTGVGSSVTSAFDTPETTGPNAGFTVSTPSNDLGAGGGNVATPFSNVAVDMLKFTIAPNTPAGVYNFQATLGFPTDPNGSSINDAQNDGPFSGNY